MDKALGCPESRGELPREPQPASESVFFSGIARRVQGALGRIDDGREQLFQARREKAVGSFFVLKNQNVAGSRIHHQILARPYIPTSTGRRP